MSDFDPSVHGFMDNKPQTKARPVPPNADDVGEEVRIAIPVWVFTALVSETGIALAEYADDWPEDESASKFHAAITELIKMKNEMGRRG